MKTLAEKMRKSIFYAALSLVITFALPIVLKNAWACLIGGSATLLFLYQTFIYYKAIKSENFITIPAKCIKKAKGDLGAMTYSEKCYFKPLPEVNVDGIIELQIVTENSALVSNKLRSKKKKKGDSVFVGELYELVFSSVVADEDTKLTSDDFTNANFIALSPLSTNANEQDFVSEQEETVENTPEKE